MAGRVRSLLASLIGCPVIEPPEDDEPEPSEPPPSRVQAASLVAGLVAAMRGDNFSDLT